jgi:hypothetical protein
MQRIFTGTSLEAHCQRIKSSYASDLRHFRAQQISTYAIAISAFISFIILTAIN